jgi:hypothetical protein
MDDLRAALERHQPSDNEFCRWCVGLWPCDASRALAALAAAESRVAALRSLVDQQAEDEGLWFVALTAPEAYLQQELRKLCAAIESDLLADPTDAEQGIAGLQNALTAAGQEWDKQAARADAAEARADEAEVAALLEALRPLCDPANIMESGECLYCEGEPHERDDPENDCPVAVAQRLLSDLSAAGTQHDEQVRKEAVQVMTCEHWEQARCPKCSHWWGDHLSGECLWPVCECRDAPRDALLAPEPT